jgi:hypothetical protein
MGLAVNQIKNLERRIFPDVRFTGNEIEYPDREYPWVLFAPHFYAQRPAVLTENLIRKLQTDGTMLSIGSGPAHLEQFLVKAYDVPVRNITLCDRSSDYVPEGFDFQKFNMRKSWPEFDKKFDYIIFPESLFFGNISVELHKEYYDLKVDIFHHIMTESLTRLKSDGEIRMKGLIPSPIVVRSVVDRLKEQDIFLDYKYKAGTTFKSYCMFRRI